MRGIAQVLPHGQALRQFRQHLAAQMRRKRTQRRSGPGTASSLRRAIHSYNARAVNWLA